MRLRRFLTPRVVATVVGLIVLVVVFGGTFRAPGSGLLPPPSSTSSTTPDQTTTSVNYSTVALPAVEGTMLDEPLVESGRSTVRGYVEAADGRLPGATVRLERLVGDRVQRLDTVTAEDGTFQMLGVPGGRYRVRAWLAPTFTVAEPDVFYIADGEDREVALRTEELNEIVVRASTRPEAPIIGDGVNLAISVADLVVDADGVGREQPRAGMPVSVTVSGWLEIDPGAVRVTDADGVVVFEFSCERVGPVSATAYVGAAATPTTTLPDDDESDNDDGPDGADEPDGADDPDSDRPDQAIVSLEVPPCAPEPTTTTAPEEDPDGGDDDDADDTLSTEG